MDVLVSGCAELVIRVPLLVVGLSESVAIIHLVVECPFWRCFGRFGGEYHFGGECV